MTQSSISIWFDLVLPGLTRRMNHSDWLYLV